MRKLLPGLMMLGSAGRAHGTMLKDGDIAKLGNHPDGNAAQPYYGLRLDGLLTGNTRDTYLFDFEHPDSSMAMRLSGTTLTISGEAVGAPRTDRCCRIPRPGRFSSSTRM